MSRIKKQSIPDRLRKQVFERDRYTCRYCGGKEGPFHTDHVYPESKGGETTINNLVTACARCNLGKYTRVGVWPMPLNQHKIVMDAVAKNKKEALENKIAYLEEAGFRLDTEIALELTKDEITKHDIAIMEKEIDNVKHLLERAKKDLERDDENLKRRTAAWRSRALTGATGLLLFSFSSIAYRANLVSLEMAISLVLLGSVLIIVGYGMAHMMKYLPKE